MQYRARKSTRQFTTVLSSTLACLLCLGSSGYAQWFDPHELKLGPQVETGPIAGAIFTYPAAGDFNGDGEIDLIVATAHHGKGTFFYKGLRDNNGNLIFEPGIEIDIPSTAITGIDYNSDGLMDILVRGVSLFLCQGGNPPAFSKPISRWPDVQADYMTAYCYGDWMDLIVSKNRFEGHWPKGTSISDSRIGMWQGYDEMGKWRGDERLGYLIRYRQPTSRALFPPPPILLKGKLAPLFGHLAASPVAIDFDSDGDHDLLYFDFVGNLFFAVNLGSDLEPEYEDPITLSDTNGERLRSPQCMARGQAVDWNKDGRMDFVFGTEDAFVYVCLNQWKKSGPPVFDPPVRAVQKQPPLDVGVAAIPGACDLDADGDNDLLIGNAAGEIYLVWNEGTNESPSFGEPKRIVIDGKTFRLIAGYNGSIQGPGEASWGYISPSVADVDGDGDYDILYNSVNGYHSCILNVGTVKALSWSPPISILADGKPLRTVWRTRPLMTDWNGDGVLDYICLDHRGEVGIFPGSSQGIWNERTGWRVWTLSDGKPIKPIGENGMEGRAKITLADWDLDGKYDLLIGVKGGTPWALAAGREGHSYVLFLKGVTGGNDAVFEFPKPFRLRSGEEIDLGDHTISPDIASFFGDKNPGLLFGGEDGRLYYYHREELVW
ncbi:MAG TPA: VCBS repeat-containing protein [bacterium]|nr:VCBS repeat-containing protein [bacterium]